MRRRHAVLTGLALAAVALALTSATWASGEAVGVLGSQRVAVPGTAVAPAAIGLGALAAVASLALALAGGALARVIGGVLAAAGLALAGVPHLTDPGGPVADAAADVVGTPDLAGPVATTLAPWGVSAAGVGLTVLGVLVLVHAGTWARSSRRFERPSPGTAGASPAPTTSADRARRRRDDSLDAWEALERGEDPTVDGPEGPRTSNRDGSPEAR